MPTCGAKKSAYVPYSSEDDPGACYDGMDVAYVRPVDRLTPARNAETGKERQYHGKG